MAIDPFTNDTPGVIPNGLAGTVDLVHSSLRLCAGNELAPNCTAMSLTTADGSYVVDPVTGIVTFTPRSGFVGRVTQPVTYQVANDWTGLTGPGIATALLTPTIEPAPPTTAPPSVDPSVPVGDPTAGPSALPMTGSDTVAIALWGVVLIGGGALLGGLHRRASRRV